MEELLLKADVRAGKSRKSELSALRKDRRIPAVVYGGDKPPMPVIVAEKELLRITKTGGANAIIHLQHPSGEDTVILKFLKRHVVTHQPIHADFQRISLKKKIEVKVPLRVFGEAPGVKLHGGVLEHILREVKVRTLPTQIPHHIDLDVGQLDINQSIWVKDLRVPEGVEILDAPDHIVVNIVQPTEEAAAPAAAEGAAAGTEPEVIAKGKKEEGEEGAEGAKGEAKGDAKPDAKGKAAAPAAEKKKDDKK